MSELLKDDDDHNEVKNGLKASTDSRNELNVFILPSPVYHWAGWDGHTGGVTAIHLDSWGLVAVNACKHQVLL
jgi:hypothetical protein